MRGSLGSFEYHTFLHHSQTQAALFRSLAMFEYHTFLHHSQTMRDLAIECLQFEYHTFLHHSQTRSKHERNAGGLSTIHFYIILKRLSGRPGFLKGLSTIHFYIILKPPVGIVNTLPLFEYHTFLHHSQTKVVWVFIAV